MIANCGRIGQWDQWRGSVVTGENRSPLMIVAFRTSSSGSSETSPTHSGDTVLPKLLYKCRANNGPFGIDEVAKESLSKLLKGIAIVVDHEGSKNMLAK